MFKTKSSWKWIALAICAFFVIGFNVYIYVMESLKHSMEINEKPTFDMSSANWSYDSNPDWAKINLQVYDNGVQQYFFGQNINFSFIKNDALQRTKTTNFLQNLVLNNQTIINGINEIYFVNTNSYPDGSLNITTDVCFDTLSKANLAYSLRVTSNDSSQILKKNTRNYCNEFIINGTINMDVYNTYNMQSFDNALFNNTLFFSSHTPNSIKISDLSQINDFNYKFASNNYLRIFYDDLLTRLTNASNFPLTIDDLDISIDMNQITNLNFATAKNIPLTITCINPDIPFVNNATIFVKAKANIAFGDLSSLNDINLGNDIFFAYDKKNITDEEWIIDVTNNSNFINALTQKINDEYFPDFTSTHIIDIQTKQNKISNLSQLTIIDYLVTIPYELGERQTLSFKYGLQAKIELVTAKTIVTGPGLILSGSINSTFFGSTYGILSDWEINIAGMSFNFSYNTKSLAKLEENFLTPFSTIIKRNFFNYGGSIPKIKFYNGSYINFYWLFNESGSGYPTPDIKLSGNTWTITRLALLYTTQIQDNQVAWEQFDLDSVKALEYPYNSWNSKTGPLRPSALQSEPMALKISNILDNLYVQKFYNTDMEEMQVRMVVNNPFDYAFLNDTKYNLRPGSKNTSWFKNHNQGYDLNGSMTGKISLLYDENICQTVIS